ncbi:MAG: hypothetical protein OYM47_05690 [Gemmatimonadota bacterium]|nr:hypothetical protein [Gemmatimonadota bacterium]
MKQQIRICLALILAGWSQTVWAADIPTRGAVVNIVTWDGRNLPPIYERSDQLPLTLEDVVNLSRNDFDDEAIRRMVQERRFAGDASAGALIELKKAGVSQKVIQAISLHALPPNRALTLSIQLEFSGQSREARRRYLYVIIPDGPSERIFTADLGAVLAGNWRRDERLDLTDPLLPRRVRRITFADRVPLKTYGARTMRVFTSTKPDIFQSSDIPEADRAGIREFPFDYPVSSTLQDCRLQVRYREDVLLPYKWHMTGAHFQCEWN